MRYGGNTSCVDLLTSDQQLIILDAGTGIRQLGKKLMAESPDRIIGTLLISHTHWDHIQGFPFFMPTFIRHSRFVVIGQKKVGQQLEKVLAGQVVHPYLPFTFKEFTADLIIKEIRDTEKMVIGDQTTVQAGELDHPGGCLGFRIENDGVTIAYCTDTTHREGSLNQTVLTLAKNANLLIHDAQYSPAQKAKFPDFGHSSWVDAAMAAKEANVQQLALFHHDPDATEADLHKGLAVARSIFPNTFLAREGMELELPWQGDQLPE